jgi:hypothetical protein
VQVLQRERDLGHVEAGLRLKRGFQESIFHGRMFKKF